MRVRVIFNPRAGRVRARPALGANLMAALVASGMAGEVIATERGGHATELAREAVETGYDRVVVAGGDGTFNEVARALMGTPVALAAVPCGSGNGLARHLGIPLRTDRAITLALAPAARSRLIDVGEVVGGRPFFNVLGLGLDAEIGARFNAMPRRELGSYVRAAWTELRVARPFGLRLLDGADRECFSGEVLLAAVANSDQYGNNFRIAPGARADDGVLAIVLVLPGGLASAASLAWRMALATRGLHGRVRRFDLAAARLVMENPIRLHVDGEVQPAQAVVAVGVRPGCLRVVCPPG
jgi:diacylglycerol kinase (ATP)